MTFCHGGGSYIEIVRFFLKFAYKLRAFLADKGFVLINACRLVFGKAQYTFYRFGDICFTENFQLIQKLKRKALHELLLIG